MTRTKEYDRDGVGSVILELDLEQPQGGFSHLYAPLKGLLEGKKLIALSREVTS